MRYFCVLPSRWLGGSCGLKPPAFLSQDDLICRRVQCTLIYCTCKGSERPNKVVGKAKGRSNGIRAFQQPVPRKGYRSPRISSRRRSRLPALSLYIAFGKGSSRFASSESQRRRRRRSGMRCSPRKADSLQDRAWLTNLNFAPEPYLLPIQCFEINH